MTRRFSVSSASTVRALIAVFAVGLAVLACAASALASLTPGDVVVERDGNGGVEALTSSATPVHLDEFGPVGGLGHVGRSADDRKRRWRRQQAVHRQRHRELRRGADAVGQRRMPADGRLSTPKSPARDRKSLETKSSENETPVWSPSSTAAGAVNTDHVADQLRKRKQPPQRDLQRLQKTLGRRQRQQNHRRCASRRNWVGRKHEGTQLNEDKNVRQVEVVDNQLYVSADPTLTGRQHRHRRQRPADHQRPDDHEPAVRNRSEPEEPYAYSFLTLGLGSTPDTIYVADKRKGGETSAIVKYGLNGRQMDRARIGRNTGSARVVTANDVNGLVTIYATTSGLSSKEGTLYRIDDASGVNGTLSGVPEEIAKAPTNEASRGVAFAPGTTIGSGGTPPPRRRSRRPETALPAALGDPTNKTMPITVEDPEYAANELTVKVTSSKESVAPVSGISVTGTRQGTGPAGHARRSRAVETVCHGRSAQRHVREHADQLRGLRKLGLRKRPLLLRGRHDVGLHRPSVAGT